MKIPAGLKISISIPSVLMLLYLIYTERPIYWLVLFLASALHEAGHLIAGAAAGIRPARIELRPAGALIVFGGMQGSYAAEWFICACGPAANLLSAALCIPHLKRGGDTLLLFVIFNAALAVFNLIPLGISDGGRMLDCFLLGLLPYTPARVISRAVSAVCLFAVWLFSVYLLLRGVHNISLFAACVYLFAALSSSMSGREYKR